MDPQDLARIMVVRRDRSSDPCSEQPSEFKLRLLAVPLCGGSLEAEKWELTCRSSMA